MERFALLRGNRSRLVGVEGVLLGNPVTHEDVEILIPIPIPYRKAHGTPVVGYPSRVGDVQEALPLGLSQVPEEGVVGNVVGDVKIREAIEVEIGEGRGERSSARVGNPRLLGRLPEAKIAFVVKEQVRDRFVARWVQGRGNDGIVLG